MRLFTEQQEVFIRKKFKHLSVTKLAEAVNNRFALNIVPSQIRSFTKNHKILSGRTGQFKKGHTPFNAGTSGLMKANITTFRKGNVPLNKKPVGHERIDSKDGYVLIKIPERNPYTESLTRFKAKHVIVWESTHGPVPSGMVIIFKDGNKLNCKLENLDIVSRAELLQLNRKGYNRFSTELKPSVLLLAKVETKIFELKRNTASANKRIRKE